MLKPEEYSRYRRFLPAEKYHKLEVSRRVQMNIMLSNMELSRLESAVQKDKTAYRAVWCRLKKYCEREGISFPPMAHPCSGDVSRMLALLRKVHTDWDRKARRAERLIVAEIEGKNDESL